MRKLTALILLAALALTGCGFQTAKPAQPDIAQSPEADLPALTIHQGATALEANIGSYNWQIDNGDGTSTGVCVDAVHPLDIADSLPLLEADSLEAQLDFPDAPESVLVWCWENEDADAQLITVENSVLPLMPGSHVYQVTATWLGSEDFTNIIHYSFRADAPTA